MSLQKLFLFSFHINYPIILRITFKLAQPWTIFPWVYKNGHCSYWIRRIMIGNIKSLRPLCQGRIPGRRGHVPPAPKDFNKRGRKKGKKEENMKEKRRKEGKISKKVCTPCWYNLRASRENYFCHPQYPCFVHPQPEFWIRPCNLPPLPPPLHPSDSLHCTESVVWFVCYLRKLADTTNKLCRPLLI